MAQRKKICGKCHEEKPLKAYRKCKTARDGRYWWCTLCCKEYEKSRQRRRKKRTKEESFASLLRRKYGLTIENFESMLEEQRHVCAICGNPPNGDGPVNSRLNVDHCHVKGTVRALLCRRCNNLLGFAEDDIEILEGCIKYLQRWGDDL